MPSSSHAESRDDGRDGDGDVSPERRVDGVEGLYRARRGAADGVVQRRGRVGSGARGAGNGPVWFTVSSTQPILGERAMWWSHVAVVRRPRRARQHDERVCRGPCPKAGTAARRASRPTCSSATRPRHAGQVRLTLIPDTGAPSTRELPIAAGRAADGQRRRPVRADRGALQRHRRQPGRRPACRSRWTTRAIDR